METSNKSELTPKQAKYAATEQEKAVLSNRMARHTADITPRMKVPPRAKRPTIVPDHPDEAVAYWLIYEAMGAPSSEFGYEVIDQLARAAVRGKKMDAARLNFMLALIKDHKPKDQLEILLLAQMACIHVATMDLAPRLGRADTIERYETYERSLNRLARTFAMQMEAAKRYRTGGEQKVTVQHVSVNEGGQAIVGNVTQNATQAAPEAPANFVPALGHAQEIPMTLIGKQEAVLAGKNKS